MGRPWPAFCFPASCWPCWAPSCRPGAIHRDPPDFVAVGNYFLSLAVGHCRGRGLGPPHDARAAACVSCWSSPARSPACRWSTWRWFRRRLRNGGGWPACWLWESAPACSTWPCFYAISRAYQADAGRHRQQRRHLVRLGLPGRHRCWWPAPSTPTPCPPSWFSWPLVPAIFAGIYARSQLHRSAGKRASPPCGRPVRISAVSGAVLFALLLFFQFGNEWSIAGWLPLFLIRRVGLSPKAALLDPGALLALPDGRTAGRGGHPAARAPRPPAAGQRARRRCSAA